MDRQITQTNLETIYADWKATLHFSEEQGNTLSAPLFLNVSESYCQAERRVLFYGQETHGWDLDFREYPNPYAFQNIRHCSDFLAHTDSIKALCWGYDDFKFAASQPTTYRSPFWRAFREVCGWPDVGIMWSNVVRMAYRNGSIWDAPQSLRDSLISQQACLVADELAILKPHVCLFFSGPNYDDFIRAVWPGCEFPACSEPPSRELAKAIHSVLPATSFRTYHPGHLNQSGKWYYIEIMRKLLYTNGAS